MHIGGLRRRQSLISHTDLDRDSIEIGRQQSQTRHPPAPIICLPADNNLPVAGTDAGSSGCACASGVRYVAGPTATC